MPDYTFCYIHFLSHQLSQGLSFGRCVLIGSQNILILRILLIQRPRPNLIQSHLKSGPNLMQRDLLFISPTSLGIHVMSKADEVVIVGKCDDASRIWLGDWEKTFQYVTNTFAQIGMKVIEDNVRVGLAHWTCPTGEVVSKYRTAQ